MSCRSSRARGRDENLEIHICFDFKKIDFPGQEKIFRIVSRQIRRLGARSMDTIDPTVWTERWLHLNLAVVTMSAGHRSVPEDFVPSFKGVSMNILLLSIHLHDLSRSFVAKDHGKPGTWVSPLPHMDIRATNACSFNFYKNLTLSGHRDREHSRDQWPIKFFKNHGFGFHPFPQVLF
jgi:hypothetical protein